MVSCFNCGHYDAHAKGFREDRRSCGYKTWAYTRNCKKFFFRWPNQGESVILKCFDCKNDFEGKMRYFGLYPKSCRSCIDKRIKLKHEVWDFYRHWKDCHFCNFFVKVNLHYTGFCSLNIPEQPHKSIRGIIMTRGIIEGYRFTLYQTFGYDSECPYYEFNYDSLKDGIAEKQEKKIKDEEILQKQLKILS